MISQRLWRCARNDGIRACFQPFRDCYLPLGEHIFAAGMHVSAMMPCGHLAFYEENGQARLSMLNLEFMTTLNPDPNLERAVEIGAPAFAAMLEEVLD